jgi:hypothetical protein
MASAIHAAISVATPQKEAAQLELTVNQFENLQKSEQLLSPADLLNLIRLQADKTVCQSDSYLPLSQKFAFGMQGSDICEIIDLSMPHLLRSQVAQATTQIPTQPIKAGDYMEWLQGNYDKVYASLDRQRMASKNLVVTDTWVKHLRFKNRDRKDLTQFRLSELDLGNFRIPDTYQKQLLQLQATYESATRDNAPNPPSPLPGLSVKPEDILQLIQLVWNEKDKVYEVLVDFDFLPLKGPATLIHYDIQYKLAVERMVRQLLLKGLNMAIGLIPEPIAQNVVRIAINDSFEMLDHLYAYQLASLEQELSDAIKFNRLPGLDANQLNKGLNLIFVQDANILSEIVTSSMLGTGFKGFDRLDLMGQKLRYAENKARRIQMGRNYNYLAREKNCQLTQIHEYFVSCKTQKSHTLHSLLSEEKLAFIQFGPTQIHDYRMPAKILLKRSTSWLLSAGIRMFDIPLIPSFVENQVIGVLKGFALSGLFEEAYFISSAVDNFSDQEWAYHSTWLYRQNIIPFAFHNYDSQMESAEKSWMLLTQ